ncbi:hypothetical protein [Anaerococcus octavius]|uniref:hypothetical protein n=1 Tax=Anaerococcus octavius TaxID=54007 RepID=UPI0027BB098D|nr:hypothetical protein [Anaerococcus octavius]
MKIKKILPKALAVAILTSTLASTSFASGSVNTNSGLYRSRRTRQAYMNLTADQRREIDAINTNNNTQITIKEVKAHGKYKLPIVKGQNYLYPFMDDRNNNGMVGENDKDAVNNPIPAEKEVAREEVLEKEAITELPETETTTSIEGVDEEKEANIIPAEYLDRLEESLKKAKQTISAAEVLTKTMPRFATEYGEVLNKLIEDQYKIITRAESILQANGR